MGPVRRGCREAPGEGCISPCGPGTSCRHPVHPTPRDRSGARALMGLSSVPLRSRILGRKAEGSGRLSRT